VSHELTIRQVADGDWDTIVRLEYAAYAALGLSEDRAALESRVHASPGTCFVAQRGGRVAGYLLALPYPAFQYPDLARAEQGAFQSDNLHLHDLVVARSLRRTGVARRLLDHLTATAESLAFDRISLVAVAGSEVFWSANGFTAHHEAAPPQNYGTHAVYMSRAVRADRAGSRRPIDAPLHG
jgi:GNAT superfamily N-acetyltransferase